MMDNLIKELHDQNKEGGGLPTVHFLLQFPHTNLDLLEISSDYYLYQDTLQR